MGGYAAPLHTLAVHSLASDQAAHAAHVNRMFRLTRRKHWLTSFRPAHPSYHQRVLPWPWPC